jgi:NitT/TauT family transport system permease protein
MPSTESIGEGSLLDTSEDALNGTVDDTADVEAGLDALDTHETARPPFFRRLLDALWPPLLAFGTVLVIWEVAYRLDIKPQDQLPSPGEVARTFATEWSDGTIPAAMWASASLAVTGFVIAIVLAIPIGIAVARVSFIRAAVGPILMALQTLPSVAWVPATTLLFGASKEAVIIVVLLGGIPSIAMGLVAGIDQTPSLYLRVGHVLGARRTAMAWFVLLPAAAPAFLSGLRQGWAFAWRSLMAAELIVGAAAGTSLGVLLAEGREAESMPAILAAVFAILLVGLAVEVLFFGPIERHLLRSRGLAGAER